MLHRVTHVRKGDAMLLDANNLIFGRSAYVCRQKACIDEAVARKRLQRSLKRPIPDVIVDALLTAPACE